MESPLNNPAQWDSAMPAPLPSSEIETVQKEINSIIGMTRDNKPQVEVVWNGDRRYWRSIYIEWGPSGEPTRLVERPIVLYRTIRDAHGKFIRDLFPPRWLILVRREREQYASTWERDSKVFVPAEEHKLIMTPNESASRARAGHYVRVKPSDPPAEWHRWFMTVAEHKDGCCQVAAKEQRNCYGFYAHPRMALPELMRAAEDRRQREAEGEKTRPFEEPDSLTEKLRENSVNNYVSQSLRQFEERASRLIDSVPFKDVREYLKDARDLELNRLSKQFAKGR